MKTLAGVIAAIVLLAFGTTFVLASVQRADASACVVDPSQLPPEGIEGWKGDQLVNAGLIMDAATQLQLGKDAQIIGVMTAMGEASLNNIGYGDYETGGVLNPDGSPTSSVGLFQQQEWWGSLEDRLNPTKAATMFYTRLAAVDGWQNMPPSHAAHRVQINSNPDHYTRWVDDATAVVDALSGDCSAPGSGEWIVPARGTVTGTFGDCRGSGCERQHMGTDLADGTCQSPIWAASAGIATKGWTDLGGGVTTIDHGNGIKTKYYHQRREDILIQDGQQVAAGELIGATGNEGTSSAGCHLHFEVFKDGKAINPETFMASVGAPLPK